MVIGCMLIRIARRVTPERCYEAAIEKHLAGALPESDKLGLGGLFNQMKE